MLKNLNSVILSFLLCVVAAASSYARHPDWKEELEGKLKTIYTLTEKAGPLRIAKTGAVLVIRIEELTSDLSEDLTIRINKIVDGQVKSGGGFFSPPTKKNARNFKPGDRVYVYKIDVKDNDILLYVVSCDLFEVNVYGTTRQVRYISVLDFQFPKNYLATADFDKVKGVIETAISPEKGITATGPKKIEVGQTPEQVESILGRPEKVINLGSKIVYVYADVKITFINGKLADVQ